MTDLTPEALRERARHTAWSCGSTNRPDLVACHECIYDAFTALMTAARREQADIAPEIAAAIRAQEETP